jgi:hypothetical protein
MTGIKKSWILVVTMLALGVVDHPFGLPSH